MNRAPPFLIGAALAFWGWQTEFLAVGIALGLVAESPRFIKARWEVSNEDFSRIWTFCSLLLLAAAVYAFTANNGPSNFSGLFQNPGFRAERNASTTSARTAAALIRWLPMIFFFFFSAQAFSSRRGIPIETISLILRLRWKKARKLNQPVPEGRTVDISFPYFAICLFAASIHTSENNSFFWGLCGLVGWALWSQRSKRFRMTTWLATVAAAIALGYFGQQGLGHLQRYLERFNPQWFSSFGRRRFDFKESRTTLGEIGRLKTSAKIVIRLEPKENSAPPSLLRETSFRTLKMQTWGAGISDLLDVEEVRPQATNDATYLLLPGKTTMSAMSIACFLYSEKSMLPLPSGTSRLEELFVPVLKKTTTGAARAEGAGFVVFDAYYGPGAGFDSIPNTNDDCAVPAAETNALDQVVSELKLDGLSFDQKLRAISGYFQNNFRYGPWQERARPLKTNDTPLTTFLLHNRTGHCEYFATATVLLLRQLKIPARYAVGWAVHEQSGAKYIVRQRDAHAWCLAWNERRKVWQDFDTTPASWVKAEESPGALQPLWDAWSRLVFEFNRLKNSWGHTMLRQYILMGLVPILALLLFQIIYRSRRQRQRRGQETALRAIAWPGLDSEFYQLEKKLAGRGLARQPGETFSRWLFRIEADPILASLKGPIHGLLRLHYQYRFDPQGLTEADREQLRQETQVCLARLSAAK